MKVAALEEETIMLRRWLGKADKFVREARKSTEIARSKELQVRYATLHEACGETKS